MILNAPFLDALVRRFFSLHHTMSVEVAVYSILNAALDTLDTKLEEARGNTENESDASKVQPDPFSIDLLFTTTDLQELLESDSNVAKLAEDPSITAFSNLATWFLHNGLTAFFEKVDKRYVRASARSFGLNKSSTMRIPHEKLISFLAKVSLDEQFHTEPPQVESPVKEKTPTKEKTPRKSPFLKSPKSVTDMLPSEQNNVSVGTSEPAEPPKEENEDQVRADLRVALFQDTPLEKSASKPKKRVRRTVAEKESPSRSKKIKATPSKVSKSTPSKKSKSTPSKNPKATPTKAKPVAPVSPIPKMVPITREALETACATRKVPAEWLDTLAPVQAWSMLHHPSKMPMEDLFKHRIPIGPTTSAWQLQQWYYKTELQSFVTERQIFLKKNKKSMVINEIVRFVTQRPESVERIKSEEPRSVSIDVLATQSEEPDRAMRLVESNSIAQSAEPDTISQPVESNETVQPAESGKIEQLVDSEVTIQSVEDDVTIRLVDPNETAQSVDSNETIHMVEPSTTAQSVEPNTPQQEDEPEVLSRPVEPDAVIQRGEVIEEQVDLPSETMIAF